MILGFLVWQSFIQMMMSQPCHYVQFTQTWSSADNIQLTEKGEIWVVPDDGACFTYAKPIRHYCIFGDTFYAQETPNHIESSPLEDKHHPFSWLLNPEKIPAPTEEKGKVIFPPNPRYYQTLILFWKKNTSYPYALMMKEEGGVTHRFTFTWTRSPQCLKDYQKKKSAMMESYE